MTNRTYPYKAWVLQPSFKPVEVELVGRYASYSIDYGDQTASGKSYPLKELFPTKAEAIAEGHRRLDKQAEDLDKKLINITKRRAALNKAASQ